MSDFSIPLHERPDCPNCGIPAMRLVSFKRGENDDYQRTFSCLGCSHLKTVALRPFPSGHNDQPFPSAHNNQPEQQAQSKLKDE